MYEDMMPSGTRIYELTAESMELDRSANDGCSMCYELYVADFEQGADRFARRLDDTENRFFEAVCAIGNNYRPPAKREVMRQEFGPSGPIENTNEQQNMKDKQTMKDEFLRDSYAIAQRRIEQLEAWITAAITKPSMSREQRLEGLEIVEAMNPSQSVRLAVERICPTQTLEQGRELAIER